MIRVRTGDQNGGYHVVRPHCYDCVRVYCVSRVVRRFGVFFLPHDPFLVTRKNSSIICRRKGEGGRRKEKKNCYHFCKRTVSTESRERTLCLRPVVLHLYISDWSRVVPLPPPYREPSFSSPSSLREEYIHFYDIYLALYVSLSFTLSLSLSRRLADLLSFLSLFFSLKMPSEDLTVAR